MKTYRKLSAALMACMMVMTSISFTACNDDDDEFGTNQYTGGVKLNVFGPCPVARGGELRFLGSGMDQINSITLPGAGDITDITVVSSEEIRITVPQNATVGKVVLHSSKGDITTLTDITYSEPIMLESVSPLAIKAGSELTLKGDYLNLIHEVIFADEVIVPETEFAAHSRYEIRLTVPEEAQSGKVIISDAAEIPNWIYSDDELAVTLPAVAKVTDLSDAKPGDEIALAGSDLDLVKSVIMPNGDEVEFTVADGKIKFTLPANVSNGTISMIPASGVKVAIATIGVALPEEVQAVPAANLWAGDVLTLKGVNMEVVTTVVFPNVADAVTPESKSATELTVKVPVGTQSGNVILNTGSGLTVEVPVATLKPENVAYNPVPASLAGQLTVNGKNLQNVKTITIDATAIEVSNPTETSFSVIVPATLNAGENAVTVTMTNDEVVELPAIELSAPECAYATVLPGEEDEVKAGDLLVLQVANGDKLTDVKVNGASVQYILNGETLYISIPGSTGKNATVTLVSSNGEISYDIAVIPMTHVENVVWEGMWENTGWGGNQDLAWGGFDWSTVPAGAVMTLYMTPTVDEGAWWCVSLRHGQGWGNLPEPIPGQYDNPENGILSVELTANVLADIIENGGLVITGSQFILNKVVIEWENSLEVTLWEGEAIADDWGNQPNILSDAGTELAAAGAKVGQTIYFYITPLDADWKVQIVEGHWGPTYASYCAVGSDTEGGKFTEIDLAANKGRVSIPVTQELLDAAYKQQWWGGTFLLNGDNVKCTKVTIE